MSGAAASSEALAGLVERVTFHNAENGFCVLRVKVRGQRDLVTVVGHAAMISAGEFVQMSGRWFNDHTHGLQFKAEFLKASPPTTIEGIERYLGSARCRLAATWRSPPCPRTAALRSVNSHGDDRPNLFHQCRRRGCRHSRFQRKLTSNFWLGNDA